MKWLGGDEPWLPAKQLAAIARKTGQFNAIKTWHDKYVHERKQVFYLGLVEDLQGRVYSRPGVAMIGETLPEMEEGEIVNEEHLADSRALRSTLELAGFDPFSPGSVIEFAPDEGTTGDRGPATVVTRTYEETIAASAKSRADDLARIHILAEAAGLILQIIPGGRKVDTEYRTWLFDNYGYDTAGTMNESERASVITALLAIVEDLV